MTLGRLFAEEDCVPLEGKNIEGLVVVLDLKILKEEFRTPENQLWRPEAGFGCSPHAYGQAVYAKCLADGEDARWSRGEFIGILKDEILEGLRGSERLKFL